MILKALELENIRSYDTLKVNCRGLKDSAGNPADSTNNRGYIKYMLFN